MLIPKEIIKQLMDISNSRCIISNEEFENIISTGQIENYILLDIRERELYKKFRFLNSINIPFEKLGEHLTHLPQDKQILIICNSGFTAAQSLSLLKSIGFKAGILQNGINGYIEQGKNARNYILKIA